MSSCRSPGANSPYKKNFNDRGRSPESNPHRFPGKQASSARDPAPFGQPGRAWTGRPSARQEGSFPLETYSNNTGIMKTIDSTDVDEDDW